MKRPNNSAGVFCSLEGGKCGLLFTEGVGRLGESNRSWSVVPQQEIFVQINQLWVIQSTQQS